MASSKEGDFEPFPVKEQFPGVDYCIRSPPPWPEALLLGFQHYIVMLGTTVFIPTILVHKMGGGDEEKARMIQTLLFVSGINTLLQVFFGTRLPVIVGGSHTFVLPTISIILCGRYSYIINPHERFIITMRGIQGALIIASFLQMLLGFFGIWRIAIRFLSPLAAVPLVSLVGLGLYFLGFPGVIKPNTYSSSSTMHLVARCIEVGLPELILLVILSQFIPHVSSQRFSLTRFSVLISIAIIWVYAEILTVAGAYKNRSHNTQYRCRADRSGLIGASPWIRVPYPFQWGHPMFEASDIFVMMAASLVALIESTATFKAVQRYSGATPVPPSIISRGAGWLGVSLLLDGMFGTANGSTASVENAGLLAMNRIGSRRVIKISAGFMIFFSIMGKFGALFASIPMPIFAAIYCILFAYTASAGLGFLQFCNINSYRTKFILGFSFFMGLSIPQYFREYDSLTRHGPVHTRARWFNDIINVIFSSSATVGVFVAFFLDTTISHGIDKDVRRRDRGWHWWEKFRHYPTDSRSEEFYSLPYNLNKFFPST
ncbi:Nucleobase ascorbate transporter [Zostera marina]|uniref:Nucleobase ascorbate transporter n=1 Tax=Zostera marina TaxID=29655 RepID=A0A0K9PKE0_ZOSMR|nr:Nucleobase ascorbate transporter [Zostera marina]